MSQNRVRTCGARGGKSAMMPLYLLLPALAFGFGCTGLVGPDGSSNQGGGAAPGGGGDVGMGANAGTGAAPGSGTEVVAEQSWRLTNAEYANTVRDLLGINVTTPLDPDGAAAGFNAGLQAGDA